MRRGQVTIDFLIVCVILLFLFAIVYKLYVDQFFAVFSESEERSARQVGERVGAAANFVLSGGNGSTAVVYLAPLSTGANYTVSFTRAMVEVTWPVSPSNRSAYHPLLTSSISSGMHYAGETISLANDGGVIRVS